MESTRNGSQRSARPCVGRKLEDGENCSATKASYSDRYCIHHLDVMEILFEVWIPLLVAAFLKHSEDRDSPISDEVHDDLWTYVQCYVEWFMGISDEKPWIYPYIDPGPEFLSKRSTEMCEGRRLKDGSKCKNEKVTYGFGFCLRCFTLNRIFHDGYEIMKKTAASAVELDLEFRIVDEEKALITNEVVETGSLQYVEYCLRSNFVMMFLKYSDLGHNKRFSRYLAPDMFKYPYPEENIPHVQEDFILRYAKHSGVNYHLTLFGKFSRLWFASNNRTHPDDYPSITEENDSGNTSMDDYNNDYYDYHDDSSTSYDDNDTYDSGEAHDPTLYDEFEESDKYLSSTSARREIQWPEIIDRRYCRCCNVRQYGHSEAKSHLCSHNNSILLLLPRFILAND